MSKPFVAKLNLYLSTGELLDIVDKSLSFTAVVRSLGYSENGKYSVLVKEFLVDNDVDTSHFTINGRPQKSDRTRVCPVCGKVFTPSDRVERKQTTCSKGCANTYFRSGTNNPNYTTGKGSYRNTALMHYKNECANCFYSEDIDALVIHHIDGDRTNNDIENLIVLCANCHTILHKIITF